MPFHGRYALPVLAGVVFFAGFAGTAPAETLEQAVAATLENHPGIESAQALSDSAAQEKREEYSGYFPEVQVSGSGGRIYGDNSTSRGLSVSRGAAYSNYWQGSLTASEMIYDGFETQNKVRAAQAKADSAAENLADTKERQAFAAVQAYVDVMRTRRAVAMIGEQAQKVAGYQERIGKMVDEGAADEAENQQAHSVRAILEGMAADYAGQLKKAEAYYAELTGHMPEGEFAAAFPEESSFPADAEEAAAFAKENHPGVKAALLAARSAGYDAQAQKGALHPDLDGELSYMQEEKDDVIGGETTDGRALLRLNWNFETGGAELARIAQKKYRKREAEARLRELQGQTGRGVRLAYAEKETAAQQMKILTEREALNEKLFATYGIQFEGARIRLLQLMQADNQLFTTRLEKMNAEYRALAAGYGILAGMGRLREAMGAAD